MTGKLTWCLFAILLDVSTDVLFNTFKGRKKKEEKGKNKRKGTQSDDGEAAPRSGRKKQKKKLETESAIVSVIPGLSIAHPSDVLDMPVDPNEPTYCLCHQVSYGEMIACDKMDVSYILKLHLELSLGLSCKNKLLYLLIKSSSSCLFCMTVLPLICGFSWTFINWLAD